MYLLVCNADIIGVAKSPETLVDFVNKVGSDGKVRNQFRVHKVDGESALPSDPKVFSQYLNLARGYFIDNLTELEIL